MPPEILLSMLMPSIALSGPPAEPVDLEGNRRRALEAIQQLEETLDDIKKAEERRRWLRQRWAPPPFYIPLEA